MQPTRGADDHRQTAVQSPDLTVGAGDANSPHGSRRCPRGWRSLVYVASLNRAPLRRLVGRRGDRRSISIGDSWREIIKRSERRLRPNVDNRELADRTLPFSNQIEATPLRGF